MEGFSKEIKITEKDSLQIINQADAAAELRRIGVELSMDDVRSASQFIVEALIYLHETMPGEGQKPSPGSCQTTEGHRELARQMSKSGQSETPYFA